MRDTKSSLHSLTGDEAEGAETESPEAAAEAGAPDAPDSADLTVGSEICFVQDIPERRWVDGAWVAGVVAQLGDTWYVTKLYQQECLNRVQVRVVDPDDSERTIDTLLIHVCAVDSMRTPENEEAALNDFTWHQPEYSDLMPTLQAQGSQMQKQSLQLVDET